MFWSQRQHAIPLVMFGVIIYLLYAYIYKGTETKVVQAQAPQPLVSDHGEKENSINLERNTNLEEITKGKTKVLWFNGEQFERLYDFCKWTPSFDCTMMKVPQGRMPIFHPDPAINPHVKPFLSSSYNEDTPKISLVLRNLEKHPEAIFIDLGANVGAYTLTIAKTLKRKVIAVEPVFQSVAQLCKSIQENNLTDYVTVVFNPLSDQHTQVDMVTPLKRLVTSYVLPRGSQQIQDKDNSACPKKPAYNTVCLDDLIPYMTSKTAIIKIDVQGYEYNAFKGAQKFMDAIEVPTILMEWVEVKKLTISNAFLEMMNNRSYVAYDQNVLDKVLDNKLYMNWPMDVVWRKKEE